MTKTKLKALASSIRKALQAKGHEVPQSVLLHAIAAAAGVTDWHVLTAALSRGEAGSPVLTEEDRKYLFTLARTEQERSGAARHIERAAPQGLLDRLAKRAETPFMRLIDAARLVLARWEHGDLAEAVRGLDAAVCGLEPLAPQVPVIRLGDKPLTQAALRAMEKKTDGTVSAIVEVTLDAIIDDDFSFDGFLDLLSERMTGALGLVDFGYELATIALPTDGTIAFRLDGQIDWQLMGADEEEQESEEAREAALDCETPDCDGHCGRQHLTMTGRPMCGVHHAPMRRTGRYGFVCDLCEAQKSAVSSSEPKSSDRPKYYRCGICESLHPALWGGDCREDANRYAPDELDRKHGALGWDEVEMPSADAASEMSIKDTSKGGKSEVKAEPSSEEGPSTWSWFCRCGAANPVGERCSNCKLTAEESDEAERRAHTRHKRLPDHYRVWAEIHTDDRAFEVKFEATRYFEQASDEALKKLVYEGYGNCDSADLIGEWAADHNLKVAELFDYLGILNRHRATGDVGYEVTVNSQEAREWIKANRPSLRALLEEFGS